MTQNKQSSAAMTKGGISPIEEIIEDFRQGKMVILVDDEDRENEGDIIIPAMDVTPESINFMASHARGLICLTLTQEHCQQLNLPLMTGRNNARYSTNFTVSIEAAEGVTTGISAADRAKTILAAASPDANAEDIVMPGHIFPIMAQPGGVLTRAGHTEAGVDLARLAGKAPASVICEILNNDGTMARLPDLINYSQNHQIKIGTIADLIRYRLENEPTVLRIAQQRFNPADNQQQSAAQNSAQGCSVNVVAYQDTVDNQVHYAVVVGELKEDEPVNVRVQVSTSLEDVIAKVSRNDEHYFERVFNYMKAQNNGVIVLIHYADKLQDVVRKLQADSSEKEEASGNESDDLRILGLGSQILVDLGVKKMNVLGTPRKMHALSGFDLEINGFIETF